jgi:peptidoglycan-N-acetylglucosamine deacetylase
VPFEVRCCLALAFVFGGTWLAAGATTAAIVTVAIAFAGAAAIAWQILSPRGQWFVPTVFRGAAHGEALALTFDDGPDPTFTPRILDTLREHGAKATFFMVGARVEAHPELVARVRDEGHQVGSHSHHHAMTFHLLRPRAMAAEIERGIAAIRRILGVEPMAFRPPIGLRVPTLRAALARLPQRLTCYTWTERGLDAFHRPAAQIVGRLAPHLVPGAILTLHDGGGLGGSADRTATVDALRELLVRMRGLGLRSVRLDELPR